MSIWSTSIDYAFENSVLSDEHAHILTMHLIDILVRQFFFGHSDTLYPKA